MNSGQWFHPNPMEKKGEKNSTAKIDNNPDIHNSIAKNIKMFNNLFFASPLIDN